MRATHDREHRHAGPRAQVELGERAADRRARRREPTPSRFGGVIVLAAVMLFASIEAAHLLGFEAVVVMITSFVELAGHVVLGIAILGLGLFLGELAARAVRGSQIDQARLLAVGARVAIVGLAGAMGLRQMGWRTRSSCSGSAWWSAPSRWLAIAFGLGSREVAGSIVADWRARWRDGK